MGYWPRKMKVRRHNWITNLGRKLVLLGCTGGHELIWGPMPGPDGGKVYVLTAPNGDEERGNSEDNATVRGARLMELI